MALSGSVSTDDYGGRYLKLSWTATQDISKNQSTIKWTLKGAGTASCSYYEAGNFYVKIAGKVELNKDSTYRIKLYKGTEVASGSLTVDHNTNGSKQFSVSVKGGIYYYDDNVSGSKTFTLDSIPRAATITSAEDFTDEGNPVLKYSNPAGSAVTSLQACIASSDGKTIYAPYRDLTKTDTSYTFSLSDAERKALRTACSASNSMTVRFYVKTGIGKEEYKKYTNKTLTIVNANPSFSSSTPLSYKDTDTTITGITNNNSMIVQNKSSLQATCTAATALKGATISKYEFWLSNNTSNVKSITTAGSVSFGAVNSNSNLTLSVKAIDSRGNSVTKTKTVTCYAYSAPYEKSAFTTKRSEDGTQITCGYSVGYAPVNNTNAINITTYYREMGTTSWSSNTVSNLKGTSGSLTKNVTINGLSNNKTYEVYAVIKDSFGLNDTASTQTILGAGRIFNVPLHGRGLALGKISEEDGFECAWDAKFYGDVSVNGKSLIDLIYPVGSIYMSVNSANPGTFLNGTTWVQWGMGRTILGVGSNEANTDTTYGSVTKGSFNHKAAEVKGGEYSHTLTEAQMPSHTHTFTGTADSHSHGVKNRKTNWGDSGGSKNVIIDASTTDSYSALETVKSTASTSITPAGTNASTGGGKAHNNIQPYITCYMWKRTA